MEDAGLKKYPIEGKFESMADKAAIEALPEVKREEILADRATFVEREKQKQMLLQIWREKEREKSQGDARKRKAGAADLDDKRKSTRQKTTLGGRKVGETSKPLEEYKRQREERGAYNEQRKRGEEHEKNDRRREDRHSDADADGESEGEDWDGGKTRRQDLSSSPAPQTQSATLRNYERAKVGRTGFAKVCFWPGFEQALTGTIVRINIGVDGQGQSVYRLCQIKSE
jgi:RNA polymerase-associated protein RTF1